MSLQAYYQEVLASFGVASPIIAKLWQELSALYQQSHRHYHTLVHLELMVVHLNQIAQITDKNAVLLAIFYHDSIYQTQKQLVSNEVQSADYFETVLQEHLPEAVCQKVKRFILATQAHELTENDSDLAYFLDLDLMILGQDSKVYQQYCYHIRQEYAHVNILLYKAARAKVLLGFLKKERIYFSELFYQTYEAKARTNLKTELMHLWQNG